MRLFNESALDFLEQTQILSSQPTPWVDSEVVDWAGVGGGSFGALVCLVVVAVLVARRQSERVREILERVSALLAACTALIQRHERPESTPPPQPPLPVPHGQNFTDSFLVQWNARAQEARVQGARRVYL